MAARPGPRPTRYTFRRSGTAPTPTCWSLAPGEYIAVYYTAAMGTEYVVPQDYGRDLEELERESPELLKYTDADNEIELVRFREC